MTAYFKKVTWTMVMGWVTSLSLVLLAVLPVLPASTPDGVRETLAIVGAVLAALTHSPRANLPAGEP